MTRGVRGAEGVRAGFGLGLGEAVAREAELAAVFLAAALRAGEDGLARPDRPKR